MYKKLLPILLIFALTAGCANKNIKENSTKVEENIKNEAANKTPLEQDNKEGTPMLEEKKDKQPLNEALIKAAEKGDNDQVQSLLKQGAEINAKDSEGRTAVMAATYKNKIDTVKILIDAGADINIRDNQLNNPFLYAGAEGYVEILRLTISKGADTKLTNRFGGTALIPASEHGHIEVIKELLTNTDIDVNHINNLGWTALLEAIVLNNGNKTQQQTVELLINHGADVNIPDKNGVTPLAHARKKGFKEIEKLLLKAGAVEK